MLLYVKLHFSPGHALKMKIRAMSAAFSAASLDFVSSDRLRIVHFEIHDPQFLVPCSCNHFTAIPAASGKFMSSNRPAEAHCAKSVCKPRVLAISKHEVAPADATFSEAIAPRMGIEATTAQRLRVSDPNPLPSSPSTRATP